MSIVENILQRLKEKRNKFLSKEDILNIIREELYKNELDFRITIIGYYLFLKYMGYVREIALIKEVKEDGSIEKELMFEIDL